jgi:hypothetical protein
MPDEVLAGRRPAFDYREYLRDCGDLADGDAIRFFWPERSASTPSMRIARTTTAITAASADRVGFGLALVHDILPTFDGSLVAREEVAQVINPWEGVIAADTRILVSESDDHPGRLVVVAAACG